MLTLALVLTLWIYLQWKWRVFSKVSKELKHNIPSVPIFGLAHLFIGDGKAVMRGIDKIGKETLKQGGIVAAWLLHNCFVIIADPAVASHVSKSCLEKHHIMKTCMRSLFGDSHLLAAVPTWRRKRRVAIPLFTSSKIKSFVPVFREQSNVLIEKLRTTAGKPVFIFNAFLRNSLEIMGQVGLDTKMDLQDNDHILLSAFEEVTEYIGGRFFKPWLHYNSICKLLPEFKTVTRLTNEMFKLIHECITSKRDSLKENKQVKNVRATSFVEQYVASGNSHGLTDVDIREELLGLLLAGTDTTSISACFCVNMLARYPDVQARLYQEIIDKLPPGSSVDDLLNLKYLDAFVKETLRLYPPTPVVVREVYSDVTLPSGVVLPKGCGILLHIWAINRNPEYWGPDADQFRPERFLETTLKHPAQFMSFSFGPRNCVGFRFAMLALKVTLSTLIRALRVCPVLDRTGEPQDFHLSYGITMKDDNNYPVIFKLRV